MAKTKEKKSCENGITRKKQLEREVMFKASLEIRIRIDGTPLFQSHLVKASFVRMGNHLF